MVDRISLLLLLLAVSGGWFQCSTAFTSSSSSRHLKSIRSSTPSSTSLNDKEEGYSSEKHSNRSDKDLKRHMAAVRSLQMSFYASERKAAPKFSKQTGMIQDLPLWRVPWVEVPGRSNVLNVHDPMYTNMFETILYGPKPWCFGHLYLQGGSQNLKSSEPGYRLSTWNDNADYSATHQEQHSATVGCLMKISDYRRMADGRLLLLVHAMERFVVTDVVETVPYSIAHVQILPDMEEIDPDIEWMFNYKEQEIKLARAMAIEESIRFHDYEYDPEHKLPCPDTADLDLTDVLGSSIAKVLPYCPYSKVLAPPAPIIRDSVMFLEDAKHVSTDDSSPTLESQLLQGHILNEPPPAHPESLTPRKDLTIDELEYELWLAINDFLISSRTPVSPVLLGLVPSRGVKWPAQFKLKTISKGFVNGFPELKGVQHDFVELPPSYPSYRRQRRLSYSAAYLLERTGVGGLGLRQTLLEIPSTQGRLRLVLERFDLMHSQKWGEFQ
jgi:Lon protease-like protein